ncbi:hypothetical protein GF319_01920 [Candidatus Bathyarchaeota archaeon]|nr:hypothetical protein [Candidatus Bathyarchaeota archaeon]
MIQVETFDSTSYNPPSINESTAILFENFEGIVDGSLPTEFLHSGEVNDTAYVVYDPVTTQSKSMFLHEHGGDKRNSIVKIENIESGNMVIDFYYKVNGANASRQVFQLYNEEGLRCVGMNTLIGYYWRYRSPEETATGFGVWKAMPSLGKVEADKWYHIEIFTDYETQMVMYGVDGVYSEWLPSQSNWEVITGISFRGNYNYPADAWYDELQVSEYE